MDTGFDISYDVHGGQQDIRLSEVSWSPKRNTVCFHFSEIFGAVRLIEMEGGVWERRLWGVVSWVETFRFARRKSFGD